MQISQIRAFLAVAELESFSLAADVLHITQPAVSKRICQMEDSLKTRLFDRFGKKSSLTPDGKIFLPHAERILLEIKVFQSNLTRHQGQPSGTLSLATSHHVGLHRLPSVLRQFKAQYSEVELDLHFMDSEDACIAIANNELEMAVVTLPENTDSKLHLEPIWTDLLHIVFAPDHPLASYDTIDSNQLLAYPAILPSNGTFTRHIIDHYIETSGASTKILLETNYLETIKVMVSTNLGWSMLPVSMLDQTLVGKPLDNLEIRRTLGIVTRHNRCLTPSSKAMIAILRQQKF